MENLSPILIIAIIGLFSLMFGILRNRQTSSRWTAKLPAETPVDSAESTVDSKTGEQSEPVGEIPDVGLNSDMVLQVLGRGERMDSRLSSRSTLRLQWESREKDAQGQPIRTRTPEEHTRTHVLPLPFSAAGKLYSSTGSLTAKELADGTYLDCHGRRVISLAERFPCFDSYDYATENRYYRWYIIVEPERLTRVYTEDDSLQIYITDDVRDLEDNCVNALKKVGIVL